LPAGVRPRRQTANYSNILPSSQLPVVGSQPRKRKSKAQSLASQSKLARSVALNNSTLFQGPRYVPIMVGQTYIKTEDIDLEALQVLFWFNHKYLFLFFFFSLPGTYFTPQIEFVAFSKGAPLFFINLVSNYMLTIASRAVQFLVSRLGSTHSMHWEKFQIILP
jgi:hypothetical protein